MAEADLASRFEAEADAEPVDATIASAPSAMRRRLLMFGVPLIIVLAAIGYWFSLGGEVSTDNAYLKQDSVSVASQIAGQVSEVMVKEGDMVEAGQLLFRLDPEPSQIRIAQSEAAIAEAQANVTALSNSADLGGTDIAAAREDVAFAQTRLDRQSTLWERGFTTRADYDAARHTLAQAKEELRSAQARQQEARARLAEGAAVPGVNPQVAAARAQKAAADLDLARTYVRAPIAGQVAQSQRLMTGESVMVGLPMLQIVSEAGSYVEANFKETDLADMRVGQPATVEIDAYPGVKLKGHVESIGAGTGSEFSILPAQNASGNWVKVTQRVPVRIAIDSNSPRKLIAGLSVSVTVRTDGSRTDGGE